MEFLRKKAGPKEILLLFSGNILPGVFVLRSSVFVRFIFSLPIPFTMTDAWTIKVIIQISSEIVILGFKKIGLGEYACMANHNDKWITKASNKINSPLLEV